MRTPQDSRRFGLITLPLEGRRKQEAGPRITIHFRKRLQQSSRVLIARSAHQLAGFTQGRIQIILRGTVLIENWMGLRC